MALPPHIPIAVKLFPHLVECAKEGRRTSYEEMAKVAGMESRMFSRPLAFIRDNICKKHNLPLITVLVQRKGGNTIANRFDPIACALLSPADYAALEQKTIQQVYDYEKWDRALSGLQEMFPVAVN